MKRSVAFGIWLVCTLAFGLFRWLIPDEYVVLGIKPVLDAAVSQIKLTDEQWKAMFTDMYTENPLWSYPFVALSFYFGLCLYVLSIGLLLAVTLPFFMIYCTESWLGWTSAGSLSAAFCLYQLLDTEPVKEE